MQEMPGIRMAFVGIKRDKDIADLWAYLKQFGADGFGESFLAPGDARRFIGWGVVETLEGAALAAIDAVERWAELDFGVLPNLVAGGAQSLEHLLAGSGVLPKRRDGRSCNSNSSNHPWPEHF